MSAQFKPLARLSVPAVLAAFALATASPAFAAPTDFAKLEDRLSKALADYDAPAIAALWDDDFVTVFPDGHVSHRAERLASIAAPRPAGPSLTSQNDSVEVQYEDAHLAVVLVRSTWRYGEQTKGDPYLATHVWISRGETWRLLSAQVARVKL